MENEIKSQDILANNEESNLIRQNLAGIIDAVLVISFFVFVTSYLPQTVLDKLQNPIRPEFYILILFGLYRLVGLLFANGTLGMRLCRIKLLNGECQQLSIKEKLCSAFFVLINGIGYYNR